MSILHILAGRNGYSVSPEDETRWCWICLIVGFIVGACVGSS